MNFIPLASSSRGNAYLLADRKSRILIECGVSYKQLRKLLRFETPGLAGCLISHEHKDHSRCFEQLLKNGIPVFASGGTAQALGCRLLEPLRDREVTPVGSFDVLPFRTFHDAIEPFGFLIQSRADDDSLVFATDTGAFAYRFPRVSIAAVECNYDDAILAGARRLPDKIKARIRKTHLSADQTCAWIAGLDKSRLREVWLLHLSDACSDETAFLRRAQTAAGPHVRVSVCPK